MRRPFLILVITCFLESCAIYRGQFDCPPDRGEPCTSVSELESRIIETNHGPDIFLRSKPIAKSCRLKSLPKRKIWINPCNRSSLSTTKTSLNIWRHHDQNSE